VACKSSLRPVNVMVGDRTPASVVREALSVVRPFERAR
jgi:hypothetical protein